MTLPPHLLEKYLKRFDELILEGNRIRESMTKYPASSHNSYKFVADNMALTKWKTNSISLLDKVIPLDSNHREIINKFSKLLNNNKILLEICISNLIGIKEDFEQGFLGDLMLKIEAEIAANYMGQAEQLLGEGHPGQYDHVPAAVLSGAVLEKGLRTLCGQQTPPISTVKDNGSPQTLNPLIDKLKTAGVFNELKAKQLRSWADIRNAAAHGKFDDFNRSDVEGMIRGISDFLGTYMT